MRAYVVQYGDTLPRIIRDTITQSSYKSVTLYRTAIMAMNAVDDGTYPVIRDWMLLRPTSIVRLPD